MCRFKSISMQNRFLLVELKNVLILNSKFEWSDARYPQTMLMTEGTKAAASVSPASNCRSLPAEGFGIWAARRGTRWDGWVPAWGPSKTEPPASGPGGRDNRGLVRVGRSHIAAATMGSWAPHEITAVNLRKHKCDM